MLFVMCIVQWSEVSNKCPMCKVSFKSLIYDVKTESNYKTVRVCLSPHLSISVYMYFTCIPCSYT